MLSAFFFFLIDFLHMISYLLGIDQSFFLDSNEDLLYESSFLLVWHFFEMSRRNLG